MPANVMTKLINMKPASLYDSFSKASSAIDRISDTVATLCVSKNNDDEVITSPRRSVMDGAHSVNSANVC